MDDIKLFGRQFLQQLPVKSLTWPSSNCLRTIEAQQWLFEHLLDEDQNDALPPARYRLSVLKLLIAKIEQSIVDPEEDVSRQIVYLLYHLNQYKCIRAGHCSDHVHVAH